MAGNSESHIVIEAKLFLSLSKEGLKLGVSQKGDGHNVSTSVFSNVDSEMAFGNIQRKSIIVVVVVLLSQAGTSLQDLLQDFGLRSLCFSNGHVLRERERWKLMLLMMMMMMMMEVVDGGRRGRGVFMKRKREREGRGRVWGQRVGQSVGHGCFGVCVFVYRHGGNQTTVLHCSMLVLPMPTLTWTLALSPLHYNTLIHL